MSSFTDLLTKFKKRRTDEPIGSSVVLSETKECEISANTSEIVIKNASLAGDLAQIGTKRKTDKITHHGYHRFYSRFLDPLRSLPALIPDDKEAVDNAKDINESKEQSDDSNKQEVSETSVTTTVAVTPITEHIIQPLSYGMLEIGMENNFSLHTWLDYFPNFFIYGIDINYSEQGIRHLIIQGDQSDLKCMKDIVKNKIPHKIPFIIDDGSHIPEHQLLCFNYLFVNLLLAGGVYIIEDIETSYWTQGKIYGYHTRYGYGHYNSIIEVFKLLLDEINNEFLLPYIKSRQNKKFEDKAIVISKECRAMISSITFGQNCIIVTKKTKEESRLYDNRDYRYSQHL